jgi:hypothetical protein
MKKLIEKFLDDYKSSDVPNDRLAELLLAYIRTSGWYLNLNNIRDEEQQDKDLITLAEHDWKV